MGDVEQFIKNINWVNILIGVPTTVLLIHVILPFASVGVETTNRGFETIATTNTTALSAMVTNGNLLLLFISATFLVVTLAYFFISSIITSENEELLIGAYNKWVTEKSEQYKREDKEDGWL